MRTGRAPVVRWRLHEKPCVRPGTRQGRREGGRSAALRGRRDGRSDARRRLRIGNRNGRRTPAGDPGPAASEHRRHHGRRPRLRRSVFVRRLDRDPGARRDGVRGGPLHRLPFERSGLLSHPCGPADRPLPAAGRHPQRHLRESRLEPPPRPAAAGDDHRRAARRRRLRDRHRRQVAPRLPRADQPAAARLRRLSRLRLGQRRLLLARRRLRQPRLVGRGEQPRGAGLRHAPDQRSRGGVHGGAGDGGSAVLSLRGPRGAALSLPGTGRRRVPGGRRADPGDPRAGAGTPRLPRDGRGDGRRHRRDPRRAAPPGAGRADVRLLPLGQRRHSRPARTGRCAASRPACGKAGTAFRPSPGGPASSGRRPRPARS